MRVSEVAYLALGYTIVAVALFSVVAAMFFLPLEIAIVAVWPACALISIGGVSWISKRLGEIESPIRER